MADDIMRFASQEDFVAWCLDEPHAGIHVFRLEPAPSSEGLPENVTLEWASPDLEYEGPGMRAYVWRLEVTGIRRYTLDGEWSKSAPGDLWLHECEAPMFIRMILPLLEIIITSSSSVAIRAPMVLPLRSLALMAMTPRP